MKSILRISIIAYYLIISVFSIKAQSLSCKKIGTLIDVELNGTLQKVLIQSSDVNNPILLWLHGGPGGSAMFTSHNPRLFFKIKNTAKETNTISRISIFPEP